jgi:hypothetical protein
MKLIKLNNHYLLVSDSHDLNVGDKIIRVKSNQVCTVTEKEGGRYWAYAFDSGQGFEFTSGQGLKILASTGMFDGLAIGDKVDMLYLSQIEELIRVIDEEVNASYIKSLASNWALDNPDKTLATNSALNRGFIGGYTQALKANADKKFTLEDMENVVGEVVAEIKRWFSNEGDKRSTDEVVKEFINSITKGKERKEWEVEVETELVTPSKYSFTQFEPFLAPKVTNGYINITKIKSCI